MSLKLYENLSELIFQDTNHGAIIAGAYEELPSGDQIVLYERHLNGRKYSEIGVIIGKNKQMAERIRRSAMNKLEKKVKSDTTIC